MAKLVTTFLILMIPFLGFSQRGKLYTGLPSKAYYSNGDLRIKRNFKNNKISGYKTFYKSGQLRSNYIFDIKGRHDSIANFYFPNGNIKTMWQYKNGVVKKRIDYTLDGTVIKGKKAYREIKECNSNLYRDRKNLYWVHRRAYLNSKLGFYDESLEDFNFLIANVVPSRLKFWAKKNIYHTMAIDYIAIENYEEALKYNFKALQMDKDNQAVLNNIGWLFLRVNEYDLALKYLDECHKINPKNYHAFFNKAKIYLAKGDYTKALDFIEKTIADDRSHKLSKKHVADEKTIWATRGELYYRLGRIDEALDDLQKALKENPANSYAHRCLALIYKNTKQEEKLCNALAKAKEYKYDKIYNTNEIEEMIIENCNK